MEHIEIQNDDIIIKSAQYINNLLVETSKHTQHPIVMGLSGGNSPKLLYPILSETIPKEVASRLMLIQIDERMVASDDEQSNQHLISTTMGELFKKGSQFFPMPVVHSIDEHANACKEYENTLSYILHDMNAIPAVALLGVGTDGHTASIFPDQLDDLPNDDRLVFMTPREKNGYYRMSLSYTCLFHMKYAVFYVPGLEKSSIVSQLLLRDTISIYPASKILHTHNSGYLISST